MDYLQFGQLALAGMVVYMVLKFLFYIVKKKFDEQNLQLQQCLAKNIEIDINVDHVAKTCDKISMSQEKIVISQEKIVTNQEKNVQSQTKLVELMLSGMKLVESVDRKINGEKK